MNSSHEDFDKQLVSSLQGEKTDFDISEAIMHRISMMNEEERKREKRETLVMAVYSGLAIIVVLILFFLNKGRSILPDFHFPGLNLNLDNSPEILIYYKTATFVFVVSLVCFGTYFINRRVYRP